MNKRLSILISVLALFFCLSFLKVNAQNNTNRVVFEKNAKIISANYINNELVFKLAIDNTIYSSKFTYEINNDEYLFFHHNTGIFIRINYYFQDDIIYINKWYLLEK